MTEKSTESGYSLRELTKEQREQLDALPIGTTRKAKILAALSGAKRVSEVGTSASRVWRGDRVTSEPPAKNVELLNQIEKMCRTLGLFAKRADIRLYESEQKDADEWTEDQLLLVSMNEADAERAAKFFEVALNQKDVDAHKEVGILLGFPKTAVDSYGHNRISEQDKKSIEKEEWMAFQWFSLSREHWREEVETMKIWATAVKALHPTLYSQIVMDYKKTGIVQ